MATMMSDSHSGTAKFLQQKQQQQQQQQSILRNC